MILLVSNRLKAELRTAPLGRTARDFRVYWAETMGDDGVPRVPLGRRPPPCWEGDITTSAHCRQDALVRQRCS